MPAASEEPARGARVAAAIGRCLGRLAVGAYRRAAWVLAAVLLLSGLATWASMRLTLDPDIAHLLPKSYPSVQQVEKLRERFGGIGYIAVVVEGGTTEARRRFADELAPRLERLPSVSYVDARQPVEFFHERALWFMDRADLETLRDRLRARQQWHIERSIIDIDDEPPPPVVIDDLDARYRAKYQGEALGAGSPYHEDVDRGMLAVLVRPNELATDFAFTKRVVEDVRRTVSELEPSATAAGLRIQLGGRYQKRVELQAVLARDLALTSALAFALVIAYLAVHFRRVGAILLVLAPLYVGVALSYAMAAVLFGSLNILSGFIGAILVGIGIDNGIHLLGRFYEERRRGEAPEAAIEIAFGAAGRVSLAGALTTASAFVCLAWTDFRAFREFGVLAAIGMVLVLASYVFILPALLSVTARLFPRRAEATPSLALPGVGWMKRWSPALLWTLLVAAFLAATGAPSAHFDADMSRLDRAAVPSVALEPTINSLLGRSQTPLVLLAPSAEQAREAAALLRERMAALGSEATVGSIVTASDLVPPDQDQKAPLLRDIATILSRIPRDKLDPQTLARVDQLRQAALAAPFGHEDLPRSLRQLFSTKPGIEPAHPVLLFPTVSTGEASAVRKLTAQVRHVRLASGQELTVAGEPMVFADILDLVARDAPRIVAATLVLVLAALWLTLGRLRLAALAVAPAVVTLLVTLGLLPRFGLSLDYLNMIIVPILLGVGVDDGAHLVSRLDAGEPLLDVWRHTGWDIAGAILTDIFGFGVLAVAEHPGLAGLGKLALIGLTVNLIACVVLLPAALAVWPLVGKRAREARGIATSVATVLGAGWSPRAPGTVGALAALPVAWLLAERSWIVWATVIGLGTLLAGVAVRRYLAQSGGSGLAAAHADPQEIVVDELLGCLMALAFVPFEPRWVLAAFILFRLFDILKPGPVRWIERRWRGAAGIIGDDLAAGALAGGLLFALRSSTLATVMIATALVASTIASQLASRRPARPDGGSEPRPT